MTTSSERPWLDAGLPTEERVNLLLTVMTLEEKVGQTHQVANIDPEADVDLIRAGRISSSLYASGQHAGNERDAGVLALAVESVQRIAVKESRLGIPILFGRDVIHGHRTVFPIPLGLAASWDEALAEQAATVAADEASQDGIAWTFAPMCDITEDPRWGRIAESLGEAPVLAGRLSAAVVRGFQGADAAAPGRVGACAKHFCGYGLVTGGRDYNTVQVGENTLRNLHLRPFRAAVDAQVLSVMAAFNDVDGIPMHAHRRLVREVLKDEWGFDGFVVGDWSGVGQLVDHGVANDGADAARQALEAGIDLDMVSGVYDAHLARLIRAGIVDELLLDDAVRRVLRAKFRLGLFEHPYPRARRTDGPTEATRVLAADAAARAMVLVKNTGVLPLDPAGSRVHVVGPFLDEGSALLGTWVLDGRGEDVSVPRAVLSARLGDRLVASDGRFSDLAAHQARGAHPTVALLGEHPSRSGEANSVAHLGLPAGQLDFLRQLAQVGGPLIAVVYTGRPLVLGEVLELADAVIVAFHPGVEAGTALADVLFGDREPGGRLPATFPLSTGHVPCTHHERATSRVLSPEEDGDAGRYLDALTRPRLPFGFGLGYTRFEFGTPQVSARTLRSDGGRIEMSVSVHNKGQRTGRELVQLYLTDPVADVTRPKLELIDWRWVELAPGTSETVVFPVESAQFAYTGRDLRQRIDTGEVVLSVGPHAQALSSVSVRVISDEEDDR